MDFRRCGGVTTAILAVLATAGTFLAQAGESVSTTPDKAQVAVSKGLAWLQSNQKENGSWSEENFPGLTALGLWAAAKSGQTAMTGVCEKAVGFITRFAQEDGGIYKPATGGRGSGGLSTYNTAICMTALHCYDPARFTPIILKARKFVAESQIQGDSPSAGGFGYDRTPPSAPNREQMEKRIVERAKSEGRPVPTREEIDAFVARMGKMGREARADLSNTGWALMSMKATQGVEDSRGASAVDLDWAAAVKYVSKLQNTDESDKDNYGGFGYEQGGDRGGTTVGKDGVVTLRGFGSMTYAGLESMIYAQVDRNDPRVKAALQWASRHWSVEENPGMGLRGLYYYYNILAKCLSLAGGEVLRGEGDKAIAWRDELVNKLVQSQKPDGSWSNTDNTFWESDASLVTAYAVLTLEYATGK